MNELERSLENVKSLQSDVILLMGDFNDKCISWNDDHATSELGKKLYDLAQINTFTQLIKEPTRYVGDTATLLDLIFTDSPHLCYHSGVSSPLANLDHCTIHCSLNILRKTIEGYQNSFDFITFGNIIFKQIIL